MLRSSDKRLMTRIFLDVLIVIAVYAVAILPSNLLPFGPEPYLHINSDQLYYPYRPGILKKVHIALLTIVVPIVLILMGEGVRELNERRLRRPYFMFRKMQIPCFLSECYKLKGAYFFGLALTFIVCKLTKHQLRQLRPHFHALCIPDLHSAEALTDSSDELGEYSIEVMLFRPKFIENFVCTSQNLTKEQFWNLDKSLPSLNVSLVSYAMGFMLLYFQARINCISLKLYRLALQVTCIAIIAGIGAERLATFNSHLCDVVAGVLIGFIVAAFSTAYVAQIFVPPRFKARRPADSVNEFIIADMFSKRSSSLIYLNAGFEMQEDENNSTAARPTSSIIYDSVC